MVGILHPRPVLSRHLVEALFGGIEAGGGCPVCTWVARRRVSPLPSPVPQLPCGRQLSSWLGELFVATSSSCAYLFVGCYKSKKQYPSPTPTLPAMTPGWYHHHRNHYIHYNHHNHYSHRQHHHYNTTITSTTISKTTTTTKTTTKV